MANSLGVEGWSPVPVEVVVKPPAKYILSSRLVSNLMATFSNDNTNLRGPRTLSWLTLEIEWRSENTNSNEFLLSSTVPMRFLLTGDTITERGAKVLEGLSVK